MTNEEIISSEQAGIKEQNSKKFSFKNFIVNHKEYFIVFGVLFIIYNIILIANGFYPYGNETMLVSDSYAQIGEFFEYLFSVLKGESSIFYTGFIAGGFEVLSSIEYMLLNPFYIIVLFFGENLVFEGFNIAIFFILLFDDFVFLWFAKKYFKKIKSLYLVLFSLLYTFSGYVLLSFCFITWLIYPALILLVADAFYRLIKDGKILRFSVIMAWYVCNCFSIGISTNIILLILFTLYIFIMVPKRKRAMAFTKLFLAYAIAVCISVVILFPSIYAMIKSSRFSNVSYFSNMSNMSKIDLGDFDGMFIDSFATIITVSYLIYLFRKDKHSKEFKFYLSSFIILIFPNIFVYTVGLLCGGTFNSFSNRFYFICEAFLFICMLKNFNEHTELQDLKVLKTDSEQKTKSNSKVFRILYICLLVFYVLSYLILVIFNGESIAVNIKSPQNSSVLLKFLFLSFVLVVIILFFTWFFSKRKLLSEKIHRVSMIFVMITTLIFNCLMFGMGTGISTNVANESNFLVSSISNEGKIKEFYVDYDYQNLFNSLDYGLVNISLYSSLVSDETISSYDSIGLYTANTSVFSNTGTLISDSLLGMNYYLSSYDQSDRPYLKLVAQSENYYLYENTLSSTGAIIVDTSFTYDSSLSVYQNFENLKTSYGVEGTLFESVTLSLEQVEIEEIDDEGVYVYRVTFTAEDSGILYTNAKLSMLSSEEQEKYSIENAYIYNYKLGSSVQDIGYFEEGETKTIYILSEDTEMESLNFTYLNFDVASKFLSKVQENDVEFSVTKNGFEVQGVAQKNSNLIVFAVDISGMEYTLNGNSISGSKTFGSFFMTYVEEGEVLVVATYRVPYGTMWAVISIIIILIIVILLLVYHYTKFRFLYKVMPAVFLVLTCLFLSYFYLFALILTIFV